jgi:hypothetical protein
MNNHRHGSAVAVVLGSGVSRDGTPARTTILRARAALRLAKSRPDVTFILSGDGRKEGGNVSEAEAMKQILLAGGIAEERLLLEEQSQDTVGNAVLTAARYFSGNVGLTRVYVVTSPFHMQRAQIAFAGVCAPHCKVIPYASRVASTDAVRGSNESGGVWWMVDFFDDIKPGDIKAAVAKLLTRRPHYRGHDWLLDFCGDNARLV